jgi:hypothetical protein
MIPIQPRFIRPCHAAFSAWLPRHNAGNHSAICGKTISNITKNSEQNM